MTTSTYTKDGEEHEEVKWNMGVVLLIVILYVSVFGLFIVLVIGSAVFYLDTREDSRASETWARKQLYDNNKKAVESCMENAATLKALIEYAKQNGQKVPTEFLKVTECPQEVKVEQLK